MIRRLLRWLRRVEPDTRLAAWKQIVPPRYGPEPDPRVTWKVTVTSKEECVLDDAFRQLMEYVPTDDIDDAEFAPSRRYRSLQ